MPAPTQVFRMATSGGAATTPFADSIGALEVGRAADVVDCLGDDPVDIGGLTLVDDRPDLHPLVEGSPTTRASAFLRRAST